VEGIAGHQDLALLGEVRLDERTKANKMVQRSFHSVDEERSYGGLPNIKEFFSSIVRQQTKRASESQNRLWLPIGHNPAPPSKYDRKAHKKTDDRIYAKDIKTAPHAINDRLFRRNRRVFRWPM
jgi:hypothetical protein